MAAVTTAAENMSVAHEVPDADEHPVAAHVAQTSTVPTPQGKGEVVEVDDEDVGDSTASASSPEAKEESVEEADDEAEEEEEEEDEMEAVEEKKKTPAAALPPLPPHSTTATGSATAANSAREARSSSTSNANPSASTPQVQRKQSSRGIAGTSRSNWSVERYIRQNAKVSRLVQAALLKTLLHAIRRGSVEGVRVAIERGVLVRYIDSRQRNLIMYAAKCDTDARLPIVVILADAGCDINHADQLGWNCLHYACASGALEVASELVRRGANVTYNPYGYGPEDFIIPKVIKAKSLLQHTEQLQHEKNVKACWEYFRRQAEKSGYAVKCRSHCDLGKPLKVTFQAPAGHSSLDRIRVVDMNSNIALWLQASKNFTIPPGDVGSITLDVETLDRPSLYRIFYEKYEPTPLQVPREVIENQLSIRNLDNGTTVSVGSVNNLVLKELKSTKSGRNTKHLSNSSREAPDSGGKTQVRRMSTARCGKGAESEHEPSEVESEDDPDVAPEDTITVAAIEEHPAVTSVTGVYRVVAMAIVSVSTLNKAKPNEYEVTIRNEGRIGLRMEPKVNLSKRTTKLIVRRSSGQAASVNPGDCLVAIGSANIEHAGLKHTLWELNEAARPMVLRFRRGTQNEKRSLFTSLKKLSGSKAMLTIAV
ncbi:hypothetical protein Poli38472_000683 [Pythium oligandrum]|uniref:Uncharacterized protein n=1 Tax=Pythium oligandrum TaxID=41045 RepID=A0A8K1CCZ3_PYTOL|nr:hypothetical protein Poli38472_000683 [Pythium oligandrum]|eukprot:TMW60641.1 hypothetical protein Poli38472_000683 [Pythium oligandrum]